jgi:hypothetical protein
VKEELSEAALAWLVSDAGYERFLKWETIFRKNPLPSVAPHIAASYATRADAMLETQSIESKAV